MGFLSSASPTVALWRVMARGLASLQVISSCSWMWSNMASEVWVDNRGGVKWKVKHPLERVGRCLALKFTYFPPLRKHEQGCLQGKLWIPSRVFACLVSRKGSCKADVSQRWRITPFSVCSSAESAGYQQLNEVDPLDCKWYLNAKGLPEAH